MRVRHWLYQRLAAGFIENSDMKGPTPSGIVEGQLANIGQAVDLLQKAADEMTETIDPDTEDWKDTSTFAQVNELALEIIERFGEWNQ